MMITEKDIETVHSITKYKQHSQEKVQQQEDVHEQIHESDDLQHQRPSSSLTNIRQSSAILEAVARQVETPILNVVEMILTNLNSGTDATTATNNNAKVIGRTPCSQMMDKEDRMVESN